MKRRPPRTTRADPLLPYTTLVRSRGAVAIRTWLPPDRTDRASLKPARERVPDAGRQPARDRPRSHPDTGRNRSRREGCGLVANRKPRRPERSEEHTSELQSLMRLSYAVF